MKMIKEIDLFPIIKQHSDKFGSDLLSTEELSSGYGIADIVFYKMDQGVLDLREDLKIDAIESFDLIKTLTSLTHYQDEVINITMLDRISGGCVKKSKNRIITYLVDKQFLIPEDDTNSVFKKGIQYNIGIRDVVAIEAKLSNWRRGLYQAYRYKQFANMSYLALYEKYIHRAEAHLDEFIRFNIGLVSVGEKSIEILYEPTSETIETNPYSAFAFESILKTANIRY